MKKVILYLLGIFILLLVGYFLGIFFPYKIILNSTNNPTTSDWYQIIINLGLAILTFLAVLVALLKDEIRKFWSYPKIEKKSLILHEILNNESSSVEYIEATSYEIIMEFENVGTESAQDTELQLEKLEYKEKGSNKYKTKSLGNNSTINWSDADITKIQIAPQSIRTIKIVDLFPSQEQPGGSQKKENTLKLMGYNKDFFGEGEWIAHYIISTKNGTYNRFNVKINWNGEWKKRETEMQSAITIN